jgi:hypothetical protein
VYSIQSPKDSKLCKAAKIWDTNLTCPIARLKAVAIYVPKNFDEGGWLAWTFNPNQLDLLLEARLSRFKVEDIHGVEHWASKAEMRKFWPGATEKATVEKDLLSIGAYTFGANAKSMKEFEYAIAKKAVRDLRNHLLWKSEKRGSGSRIQTS